MTALSDLTPGDCVQLLKSDEYAMAKLLAAETQLNFGTKLMDAHMTKDVLWRVMMNLSGRYGKRLQFSKKKRVSSATGTSYSSS